MKSVWPVWMVIVASALAAQAQDAGSIDPNELNRLLDAIAKAESNNDPNATGDGGAATGIYQIHRAYWADGTRFLGVQWGYVQARDPARAREVVRAYLLHYGRGRSLMEMARIHNGGPTGHRKPNTLEYARRIATLLNAAPANSRQR